MTRLTKFRPGCKALCLFESGGFALFQILFRVFVEVRAMQSSVCLSASKSLHNRSPAKNMAIKRAARKSAQGLIGA